MTLEQIELLPCPKCGATSGFVINQWVGVGSISHEINHVKCYSTREILRGGRTDAEFEPVLRKIWNEEGRNCSAVRSEDIPS